MTIPARRCAAIGAFFAIVAALLSAAPAVSAQAEQTEKVIGIEVRGNANINSEAILAATRTTIGADLSEQQLEEDRKAIDQLGFFHEVRWYVEPALGGVKVVFGIVENPKVTAIQIVGNTRLPEATLRGVMLTQVGSVFNDATFEKDISAIQKLYRDRGYVLARVTEGTADEPYGIAPDGTVRIPIAEGWIEAIRVTGNKKTKTKTITRELDAKPGDIFDTHVIQGDLQRLRNLDFFEVVEPRLLDGSEPGKVILVLDCKEKKTGTVSVGLGYSSRERLVGFADITEHNFRGLGQQIGIRWEAGQFTNRSGYELSFTDPWMLGKRTSLGFQVYNRTTNRPLVLGGDTPDTWIFERRRGAAISVGKSLGRRNRLLVDLRSDDVGFSPVEGFTPPPADLLASEGRVTSLTLRGIHNTRHPADINPHRGSLHSASIEVAGGPLGGRWSFSKIGADLRRYFPIGKAKPDGSNQKVLAMRLMGGLSLGGVPLSENYWIGGAESLRGYREDQFHGTRVLLFSTEFRVPFGSSLQGVTFFDYGYAWPKGTDLSLGDLQAAVGIGLRVVTPLGPLRLDYGFGKDGGRSHFSIGHVF